MFGLLAFITVMLWMFPVATLIVLFLCWANGRTETISSRGYVHKEPRIYPLWFRLSLPVALIVLMYLSARGVTLF